MTELETKAIAFVTQQAKHLGGKRAHNPAFCRHLFDELALACRVAAGNGPPGDERVSGNGEVAGGPSLGSNGQGGGNGAL